MWLNDHDAYAAAWLRNLFPGAAVDDRSILAVEPSDFVGHPRCHFFAGIGGWEYALRLAGWPDDAPVWTASLPCQPFSGAGLRKGTSDERHLWPAVRRLVAECRPPIIFGEQVASRLGRDWLAGVRTDLEALGYAVGAADLCAASVGAPHIRQRLFWVAESGSNRSQGLVSSWPAPGAVVGGGGPWTDAILLPCLDGKARRVGTGLCCLAHGVPARVGRLRAYGNAIVPQVASVFIRAYMETRYA